MRALLAALALAFILISFPASALEFVDTNGNDFNMGSYVQARTDGENVTLLNDTAATYYASGDFTKTHAGDAGTRWRGLSWAKTAASNQNVTLNIRFSNDSISWDSWRQYETSPVTTFNVVAMYAQYQALLSTQDTSKTPYLEAVTLTYEGGPPVVNSSYPPNGHVSPSDSMTFGCSASSLNGMANMTFYWNYSGAWEANGTQSVSGTSVSSTFARSGLANGTQIRWGCLGEDVIGQMSWSSNRTMYVSITISESDAPSITYDVSPSAVRVGGTVSITVNASDASGVDRVWAVLTLPDQSNQTLQLQNGQPINYTTLITGQHTLYLYANDTFGNKASGTASFSAEELITINSTVYGYDGSGLASGLVVYVPDTYYLNNPSVIDSWTSPDGRFTGKTLVGGTYDLEFSPTDVRMVAILKGVDIGGNREKGIGMDELDVPEAGYMITYGAENTYSISGAVIVMEYDEADFESEDSLGAYMCSTWDFGNRSCSGTWSKVTSSTDSVANTVEVSVSILSLAGFSIKQEAYCGDGICGAGESASTCPDDCECTTGLTRACGTSDIPPCQMGIQTCTGGVWGICSDEIAPTAEVCNGVDDDCDGVVDNLNGGTSVIGTGCQCYNGGSPINETCNGVDDDCDGQVDENIERQCGSNVGACRFGISRCIDGSWGECYSGVNPTEELCGDGLDNNCNGQTDEGCANCFNGVMDGDEEGVDCGGSCANACFELPWMVILIVVLVVGGALAAFFLYFNKKPPSWSELEEKYGAARAIPTIEELEEEFGN